MGRARRPLTLLAAVVLALFVLGPASARPSAPARFGGELVVGLSGGDPTSLDPTTTRGGSALTIYLSMCQRLYTYDSKLHLVPLLAASVPALSKDKLSYTIALRKGILFNDGTPFNAQAVVTTVQRFITYPGSDRASDYTGVDSVTASGPYTVVYQLKARDSTLTGSNPYALSPTELAKPGSDFAANPVCVGPFMFDHRDAGVDVTVIKSPYYYDRSHVYLDKIVYKPMPDAPAAAAALSAGDIQALDNVSTTELASVRQNANLRVLQQPQLGWLGIFINLGNRHGILSLPYQNVGTPLATSSKLRQAFEEAIDRNTFNRVVFGGLAQVTCTAIPPANTLWYDVAKVPCTPYDPVDARKLVAASGFPNPTVHLSTSNATDSLRRAQFIQAQEAAVGINVVIDSFDPATAGARATAGNYEVSSGGLEPGSPDSTLYSAVATSGSRNYAGYSSPRMDLVAANALKASSFQARATLYRVAQQIVQADRPFIPLANTITFAAFSTSVTGVRLDYRGLINVANAQRK